MRAPERREEMRKRKMGVTIRQIAEAAGVSRGTVDRALNNRGRIRPEVAERIQKLQRNGISPEPAWAGTFDE